MIKNPFVPHVTHFSCCIGLLPLLSSLQYTIQVIEILFFLSLINFLSGLFIFKISKWPLSQWNLVDCTFPALDFSAELKASNSASLQEKKNVGRIVAHSDRKLQG